MSDNVVDLELVRREKSNDARDWSVVDALKEAIANIESGKWKPTMGIMALVEDVGDGTRLVWNAAGCSRFEMLGILASYMTHLSKVE
jgi:hypothetical protein